MAAVALLVAAAGVIGGVAGAGRPRGSAGTGTTATVVPGGMSGYMAVQTSGAVPASLTSPSLAPNRSLVAHGGQFLTTCLYTHQAMNDPIVHAGMPGMSHLHEFFGNTTTTATSTAASLLAGPTTCSDVGDHSGYWVPALYVDGRQQLPRRVDAYYRVAPGVRATDVRPFPAGLQALAGNQYSQRPQSLGVAAWACGMSPQVADAPPGDCTGDRPLQLRLTFPSCSDGRSSSADHVSHLAYPNAAGCPRSHAIPIPQLTLVVHYPVTGPVHEVHLASGPITTAHGDFFDAWQPARIAVQVTGCIDRSVVCGIVGGTFHTGEGSGDADNYDLPS